MSQGNILGNPFEPWVKEQIEVRQKKLGESSNHNFQNYSTKTPWIRLASSVDITKDEKAYKDLKKIGFEYNGDQLAKDFVLFGGSSNYSGSQSSGFGNNLNSAYGWGGINNEDAGDRGYVPMPGIESANVTYQNNGALAKITVNIKCYTRRQLALIDYLYLRPGYTLLLEFGWSSYFNNRGDFITLGRDLDWGTLPFNKLFTPGTTQYDLYDRIQKEKVVREGNYEGYFGKITNFKWSLNKDGSYNCEIKLTTLGDVIESLKLNTSSNATATNQEEDENVPPVESLKTLSELNRILYEIHQVVADNKTNEPLDYDYRMSLFSGSSLIKFKQSLWNITGVTMKEGGWFSSDTTVTQTYMKFGLLCAIIQNHFLIYNKDTPITGFDINYEHLEKDYNYMFTFPGQISADPSVCLIPLTDPAPPISNFLNSYAEVFKNNSLTPKYESFYFNVDEPEDDPFKGRISNIFVNINYLSNLIHSIQKDENNKISILDYLRSVLDGISSALGGINNFTVEPNINSGLVKIYDKSPQIVFHQKIPTVDYSKFNIFGVRPNFYGSFVRSVNMVSELSSNFASMVTIGAQSQGNQTPENATSFSEFNKGLVDRIIPEKTPNQILSAGVIYYRRDNYVEYDYVGALNQLGAQTQIPYNDSYIKVYGEERMFIPEYIESLRVTLTEYNKLFLGWYFDNPPNGKKVRTPFFLPFTLSLEMDGLAGMILYQKFLIYENVLPLSYGENNVDFIIKGIDHTITPSGWITKIEAIPSPIPKIVSQ